MHTKHDGLLATWKVPIKDKHYFRVFIWETVETLRKMFGFEDDTRGYACTMPYAKLISGEGEKIRLPKKFAEVHLHKDQSGVGTVAHEIQHVLNYWICANELNSDEFDEEIAHLAGEMTREYWNEYYERYE